MRRERGKGRRTHVKEGSEEGRMDVKDGGCEEGRKEGCEGRRM